MFDAIPLPLFLLLDLLVVVPAFAHVLLTKDNEGPAFAWIALILLSPFVGVGLYVVFGINRVERRARKLRRPGPRFTPVLAARPSDTALDDADRPLATATSSVQNLPLLPGHQIDPLLDGDEAYPAMLAAIAGATQSIAMSVYIFDHDKAGVMFTDALAAARDRGVAVHVLIDDMGLRYSPAAIDTLLRQRGLKTARFLPTRMRLIRFVNLRNHRKMLIVDGSEAFIGGMNIRHGHMIKDAPRYPVKDIHFRVRGPIIDQMNDLFAEDWGFAAGEDIDLPSWKSHETKPGTANARLVPDGPDHDFERLHWVILCALGAARSKVRVMTPYFLPNQILAAALMSAALRGVDVEVMVPSQTNIPFIGWAMAAGFQNLLEHRVKIFLTPPPFDHGKLMTVDDRWGLIGSTNWDPRSLRLNFEANLECFDPAFVGKLDAIFEHRKAIARMVDLAAVRRAPLGVRLRNNFMRLFSPYL
ncbi:MAG: cardiolipin synthase [Alphaproteobacteria bacterium]|nr:cardiolipin synthase [Alphaproteobacteria bacterium]